MAKIIWIVLTVAYFVYLLGNVQAQGQDITKVEANAKVKAEVEEAGNKKAKPEEPEGEIEKKEKEKPAEEQCNCTYWYSTGGCSISKPAPSGSFCKCNYRRLWKCWGQAFKCPDGDQNCKDLGTLTTYRSCLLAARYDDIAKGESDCGGYYKFRVEGKPCYRNYNVHKEDKGNDCY